MKKLIAAAAKVVAYLSVTWFGWLAILILVLLIIDQLK